MAALHFTFIPCLNDSDGGIRVLLHVDRARAEGLDLGMLLHAPLGRSAHEWFRPILAIEG